MRLNDLSLLPAVPEPGSRTETFLQAAGKNILLTAGQLFVYVLVASLCSWSREQDVLSPCRALQNIRGSKWTLVDIVYWKSVVTRLENEFGSQCGAACSNANANSAHPEA